jgi:beta-galactosidase
MNKFFAAGGQFWLNDQPQFIQAGEFHYFRTPKKEWAHRLGLLKAAGFNAVASYIPWLWHQTGEGDSDLTGQSHPMRDLAGFLDLAADLGLMIIARPGPYINAETINEGIPPWVFQIYPQVAFVNQEGLPQNMVSYRHPDFLACVKQWYKAVFQILAPRQITRDGRIVLIQLDNEMGMISWVRNHLDINPDTIGKFAVYLKKNYGSQLAERYPSHRLEEFLANGIRSPQEAYGNLIVDDYRRFSREYLRNYTEFLWNEAKSNGMEVPPVINIHGFANGGKTFPVGISQLIEVMRMDGMVSATDVYPGFIGEGTYHQLLLVNEMVKAVQNPQQPLFSIEFQAGGNQDYSSGQSSMNDLHSRLCISNGMRAINHYLFCDGENHPVLSPTKRHDWGHPVRKDGTLRRHYYRYPRLSAALHAYGSDLILAQPRAVTTIGFQLDNFMTEVNNPFSQPETNIITHQRDDVLFDMIARGLALTHRPFNAIELESGILDVQKSPTLWVMMEKHCNPETQLKLINYIKSGGKLILAGRMCQEDFQNQECNLLKEAIGIKEIRSKNPSNQDIDAFDFVDIPVSFVETYTGDFDNVFATQKNGEAVGFIKNIGKGKVMVFGAAMPANTLDDVEVVNQMALRMDCQPLFELSNWVDARMSIGEHGSFLFINNYQDDPVETTVEYDNTILFGGNSVQVQARRGVILPIEWEIRPGVLLHYLTSEVVAIVEDEFTLRIKTDQNSFFGEISVTSFFSIDLPTRIQPGKSSRIKLHSNNGEILLYKITNVR